MLLILIGLIISYLYSFYILPENEGSEPLINPTIYPILKNGMMIIPYNNTCAMHIHHWIICLIICLASLFIYIPKIIIGFSLGLFIQGISYKDSFNIICNNPY